MKTIQSNHSKQDISNVIYFLSGKDFSSGSRNLTSESSPNSRDTTMAMQALDPNCILDIERSARHLATSVDEMVENLSGLLQGMTEISLVFAPLWHCTLTSRHVFVNHIHFHNVQVSLL